MALIEWTASRRVTLASLCCCSCVRLAFRAFIIAEHSDTQLVYRPAELMTVQARFAGVTREIRSLILTYPLDYPGSSSPGDRQG